VGAVSEPCSHDNQHRPHRAWNLRPDGGDIIIGGLEFDTAGSAVSLIVLDSHGCGGLTGLVVRSVAA
jgi:hypothetical protein